MLNDLLNMHELDQKVLVKSALAQLKHRLQFIAMRRFYQNQTLAAIAEELGLSNNRVWQLELEIIWTIRRALEAGRM